MYKTRHRVSVIYRVVLRGERGKEKIYTHRMSSFANKLRHHSFLNVIKISPTNLAKGVSMPNAPSK